MQEDTEISIVLPCRNEENGIGICINKIKEALKKSNINGEIIVSDSSSDSSPKIAEQLGAKVVRHSKEGYGAALFEGFKAAKSRNIFFADADCTYDFLEIPRFLKCLQEGYDFVIGNRFSGRIAKNAMSFSHRHIGNPALSAMLRLFFKSNVGDAHCGMRAITKDALGRIALNAAGMEFASEMVIMAAKHRLKTKELPINYNKRIGKSKLNTFSDGWRHLRFMLIYAPNYLFLAPGLLLLAMGAAVMAALLAGPVTVYGITLYSHPMVIGSFMAIAGFQVISLGVYARAYAVSSGLEKKDWLVSLIAKHVKLESGLAIGAAMLMAGLGIGLFILIEWIKGGFPSMMKFNSIILGLTLGVIGIQAMFSSFFLSMLLVKRK